MSRAYDPAMVFAMAQHIVASWESIPERVDAWRQHAQTEGWGAEQTAEFLATIEAGLRAASGGEDLYRASKAIIEENP